jgi:hypothetical protein
MKELSCNQSAKSPRKARALPGIVAGCVTTKGMRSFFVIQICMAVVVCPPWYLVFFRSSLLLSGQISDQRPVFLAAETDEVVKLEAAT